MENQKTIREWLEELPEGYRERAIKNTPESESAVIRSSFCSALIDAFVWHAAPEGCGFWADVHTAYANGMSVPLPPLPEDGIESAATEPHIREISRTDIILACQGGWRPDLDNSAQVTADEFILPLLKGVWKLKDETSPLAPGDVVRLKSEAGKRREDQVCMTVEYVTNARDEDGKPVAICIWLSGGTLIRETFHLPTIDRIDRVDR